MAARGPMSEAHKRAISEGLKKALPGPNGPSVTYSPGEVRVTAKRPSSLVKKSSSMASKSMSQALKPSSLLADLKTSATKPMSLSRNVISTAKSQGMSTAASKLKAGVSGAIKDNVKAAQRKADKVGGSKTAMAVKGAVNDNVREAKKKVGKLGDTLGGAAFSLRKRLGM